MAQTLMTISNVLLVLALLFIVAAAIVFFKFQIREVIAELSGKSARKSIEQLREDNKKSGVRRFRVLDRTGTDQVSVIKPEIESGELPTEPLPGETLQKNKNVKKSTEPLESEPHDDYKETTGLEGSSEYLETSYMDQHDYQETSFMSETLEIPEADGQHNSETQLMEEDLQEMPININEEEGHTIPLGRELKILQEIVLIHTEEEIQDQLRRG